jgi:hypothetical protein
MTLTLSPEKDWYTEAEAVHVLGITPERLHLLLDHHIFNDGKGKPATLSFRTQDLVMLRFWDSNTSRKVVRMPRR